MANSSNALKNFRVLYSRATKLAKYEGRYNDPPDARSEALCYGLRSGSITILVSAFEVTVVESVKEGVARFNSKKRKTNSTMTDEQFAQAVRLSFELYTGPRGYLVPPPPVGSKLSDHRRGLLVSSIKNLPSGILDPLSYAQTASQLKWTEISDIYARLGGDKLGLAANIESAFPGAYGKPIFEGFVAQKLSEIIENRNSVAHYGLCNFSRADLLDYLIFIKALTTLLEREIRLQSARIW